MPQLRLVQVAQSSRLVARIEWIRDEAHKEAKRRSLFAVTYVVLEEASAC